MEYLTELKMTDDALRGMSALALAHIGDAVYELLARTRVCAEGRLTSGGLHRATVELVCARAQYEAAKRVLPVLTDGERDVLNRGRNAKVHAVPKGSSFEEYHMATALESLFGWLYLKGELARVRELFEVCTGGGE
ncbi:MAG: ribonuclease III [Oscillospiraceae bacterium]|jgi:ribonuclease-3 family protein|nr:ribonuclease III [Oscillospiraceae bacterium]